MPASPGSATMQVEITPLRKKKACLSLEEDLSPGKMAIYSARRHTGPSNRLENPCPDSAPR